MSKIELTAEQEAEAQRLAALVGQKVQEELLQMYRLLMAKPDSQLVGLGVVGAVRQGQEGIMGKHLASH